MTQHDATVEHFERICVPDEKEQVSYTTMATDKKRQLNHSFVVV